MKDDTFIISHNKVWNIISKNWKFREQDSTDFVNDRTSIIEDCVNTWYTKKEYPKMPLLD